MPMVRSEVRPEKRARPASCWPTSQSRWGWLRGRSSSSERTARERTRYHTGLAKTSGRLVEEAFDGWDRRQQARFMGVGDERFEGAAVGLDAVRPAVGAEDLGLTLHGGAKPGQGRVLGIVGVVVGQGL